MYPYVVVVRESTGRCGSGGGPAIEHRFVGLFTVAAMNANVLDIPVITSRVHEALRKSGHDPASPPGQLLVDVIQTFPRPELFAVDVDRLLAMANAVVDLGSRRRTLLFLRADELSNFVSCLVYLPRDRYTTAVQLTMQDILVGEFGGTSIDYTARVIESPWAAVHFTVRLPEGTRAQDIDMSDENRLRVQTHDDRGGAHLGGPAGRGGAERHDRVTRGRALRDRISGGLQAGRRHRWMRSTTSRSSRRCEDDSVKLVFSEGGSDRAAQLTWFLGGRSASLSQLLPMLQSMGVVVLEERPFTVRRPDGLPVWIYQFKISLRAISPIAPAGLARDEMAQRFADAVAAIWRWTHGSRPIQRTRAARGPDVATGRGAACVREIPAAGGFSLQPIPYRIGTQREPPTRRGRWSTCLRRSSSRPRRART